MSSVLFLPRPTDVNFLLRAIKGVARPTDAEMATARAWARLTATQLVDVAAMMTEQVSTAASTLFASLNIPRSSLAAASADTMQTLTLLTDSVTTVGSQIFQLRFPHGNPF